MVADKVTGMSKKRLIPAVGYLRKSTKGGVTADGRPQHEKSLADQKARIQQLKPNDNKAEYQVVRWYADPGIPGWKRGHKRPDYSRLVEDLREHKDIKAVLIDDMDRFSRADPMQTVHDVQVLRDLGLQYIHAANQGMKDLSQNVAMMAMQIAMEANASHEFSTRLSRRVASAHRDRAKDGKRSGRAPYGYANDGDGGLKFGDPKKVRTVRRIFELFVDRKWSLNAIASELNAKSIPTPRGGAKWYVQTVKDILRQPAYKGTFEYGRRQQGQFHTTSTDGQVVKAEERSRPTWQYGEPAFQYKGKWKPLVSDETWEAGQARLASFSLKGNRRPRKDGYPLAGILFCSHCGKPLYGCHVKGRKYRVYRCGTNAKSGMGTCGTYEIREERILPFVLERLQSELGELERILSSPPDDLKPGVQEEQQREELAHERGILLKRIDVAEERILSCDDVRTRQSLDKRVTAMRDRLDEIESKLNNNEREPIGKRLAPMVGWFLDWERRAVSVAVTGVPNLKLWQSTNGDGKDLLVDPRVLNEALHELGTRITLRWTTKQKVLSNGKTQNRHTLNKVRFQLGQQNGEFKAKSGVSLRKAKIEEPSSDSFAAGRFGSRTGRDSMRQSRRSPLERLSTRGRGRW